MSHPDPRDFRAVDALVVLVVLFGLLVALALVFRSNPESPALTLSVFAAFPAAVVLGAMSRGKSPRTVLAPGRFTPSVACWTVFASVGLALLGMSVGELLVERFPAEEQRKLEEFGQELFSLPRGVLWLLAAVLAPIGEECLFRGAFLKGVRASWGTAAGLIVSAILFAAAHGIAIRMAVTFPLGLWLGFLAVRTGGLAAPILAHAVNNTLVLGLATSGVTSFPVVLAAPGAAAFLVAAWRLFRSPSRSVQGSGPPGAS